MSDVETAEAKAALLLRLRGAGLQDVRVLRAFELVPRQAFAPPSCRELAGRDVAVPIGCGQMMAPPLVVARMIEALAVAPDHRILEIGTGTGYVTALLAHLAAEVMSVERYKSLAACAGDRLAELGLSNAAAVWADGLAMPDRLGTFDRLIVHATLADQLAGLAAVVSDHGTLVCARAGGDGATVVRIAKGDGSAMTETTVCPCRLQPIVAGLAGAL